MAKRSCVFHSKRRFDMLFAILLCVLICHDVVSGSEHRQIRPEVLNIRSNLSHISNDDTQKTNNSGKKLQTHDTTGYLITKTAKPFKSLALGRTPTADTSSTTVPGASTARTTPGITRFKDRWTLKKFTNRASTKQQLERQASAWFWRISVKVSDPSASAETKFTNNKQKFLGRKRREVGHGSHQENRHGNFPDKLGFMLTRTDEIEYLLLEAYMRKASRGVIDMGLDYYNRAKSIERHTLKVMLDNNVDGGQRLIDDYRALRKEKAWSIQMNNKVFNPFFETPSPALEEYMRLKQNERDSVDSFLAEIRKPKATQNQQKRKISDGGGNKREAPTDAPTEKTAETMNTTTEEVNLANPKASGMEMTTGDFAGDKVLIEELNAATGYFPAAGSLKAQVRATTQASKKGGVNKMILIIIVGVVAVGIIAACLVGIIYLKKFSKAKNEKEPLKPDTKPADVVATASAMKVANKVSKTLAKTASKDALSMNLGKTASKDALSMNLGKTASKNALSMNLGKTASKNAISMNLGKTASKDALSMNLGETASRNALSMNLGKTASRANVTDAVSNHLVKTASKDISKNLTSTSFLKSPSKEIVTNEVPIPLDKTVSTASFKIQQ